MFSSRESNCLAMWSPYWPNPPPTLCVIKHTFVPRTFIGLLCKERQPNVCVFPSYKLSHAGCMGACLLAFVHKIKHNGSKPNWDLHAYTCNVHALSVMRNLPYIDLYVISDPCERICTWAPHLVGPKHQLLYCCTIRRGWKYAIQLACHPKRWDKISGLDRLKVRSFWLSLPLLTRTDITWL